MKDTIQIKLHPLNKTLDVEPGASLRDVLFPFGVEFPCGGRGQCKGCRVRVLQGDLSVTDKQRDRLKPEQIADGWRLACQCRAESDLVLELAQWKSTILTDETSFAFEPRDGLGVAVDVGTTTLAAQLMDLREGRVLGVRTALNPQATHGADIMRRVSFAATDEGGRLLRDAIRNKIGAMIDELIEADDSGTGAIVDIVLVGNTAMHHLFCGIDVEPLSRYPFQPEDDGQQTFRASELGWTLPGDPTARFLPCLGGFVGSDILAGILATGIAEGDSLQAFIDLGTNGEIVVGNRERILCASTAAGPAFEGARISMGMRAATGAIAQCDIVDGQLTCHVIGGGKPRGICGSGLVDVIAGGLEIDRILPSGRFADKAPSWSILPPVEITQTDIRETQLAKGAIAAGIRILVNRFGAKRADIERVYLAGAFGNYIDRDSARRIGLIDFPPEIVIPSGNTALLGAKVALFNHTGQRGAFAELRQRIKHVPLNADPQFQDIFVEEMGFPGAK